MKRKADLRGFIKVSVPLLHLILTRFKIQVTQQWQTCHKAKERLAQLKRAGSSLGKPPRRPGDAARTALIQDNRGFCFYPNHFEGRILTKRVVHDSSASCLALPDLTGGSVESRDARPITECCSNRCQKYKHNAESFITLFFFNFPFTVKHSYVFLENIFTNHNLDLMSSHVLATWRLCFSTLALLFIHSFIDVLFFLYSLLPALRASGFCWSPSQPRRQL